MFEMKLKKKKIEIEVIDFDSMDSKELAMYGIVGLMDKRGTREMIEAGRGEEAALASYNEVLYITKLESQIQSLEKQLSEVE